MTAGSDVQQYPTSREVSIVLKPTEPGSAFDVSFRERGATLLHFKR